MFAPPMSAPFQVVVDGTAGVKGRDKRCGRRRVPRRFAACLPPPVRPRPFVASPAAAGLPAGRPQRP